MREAPEINRICCARNSGFEKFVRRKLNSKLSLEKAAVRLFGPGGRLPGSSTNPQNVRSDETGR